MKKFFVITVLLLSGCVQNRLLSIDSSGRYVYQADCHWTSFEDCIKEAAKTCPKGYNIMMSNEEHLGRQFSPNTHNVTDSLDNVNSSDYNNDWNTYRHSILYSCKTDK